MPLGHVRKINFTLQIKFFLVLYVMKNILSVKSKFDIMKFTFTEIHIHTNYIVMKCRAQFLIYM